LNIAAAFPTCAIIKRAQKKIGREKKIDF